MKNKLMKTLAVLLLSTSILTQNTLTMSTFSDYEVSVCQEDNEEPWDNDDSSPYEH